MQEGLASLKGYRAQLKHTRCGSASLNADEIEILDLTYLLNQEEKESGGR